ncbi:nucleotidyltransferase substrate binding protein [Algoriphagus confluentis]|uniref:Nucleotidyltransferase substrate binding protein n=1 Tax=Algoriphagus confluentis TaxID=1697556 RepID=A0ABQ6PUF6_9BACT|nr:nucleotidyltransferase substrate binding protein [Algoriphagus confluentis]
MEEDIRWHQRLSHYSKALTQLEQAVALSKKRELSSLEQQGLIQAFEFTHELAWNILKDYFVHQGNSSITGSRDATREAFRRGLIEDGESWMEMIKSRNQSSHTYNEEVATEISAQIKMVYFGLLKDLEGKLSKLQKQDHG